MFANRLPTDGLAALDQVTPVSQAAGTVSTVYFSATNFHTFLAMITTGVLGASATLDAKLQQAQDAAGTGVKDITGKALTQIVKASGDNKVAFINCRATDLDANNGYGWIRLTITVGVASSLITGHLFGFAPLFAPPKDATASPAINLGSANVVQIV